jgi:hypothetical protein
MTLFNFDHFSKFETPNFSLLNPNGDVLYNIGSIYDRQVKLRYNSLSEISFTCPAIVNGIFCDFYDSLDYRRVILVENIGNFMITQIIIENNGVLEEKKIVAQSIEVELNFKHLSIFKGTYAFYNPITPSGTLLGIMLTYLPDWSIGHIDTPLTTLWRTFDIVDKTIYSFLVNEVANTFQAVFVFDSLNKTISAYTSTTATITTDIFLSYDNLIENTNIKENTDELVTALGVYGSSPLSINLVNPLGTNSVYNFQYYLNTEWMTQSLIDVINIWNAKILVDQPIYANLLTLLREYNMELLTLKSDLVGLQAALTLAQEVQKVTIQSNYTNDTLMWMANVPVKAGTTSIQSKQSEIDAKQLQIDGVQTQLQAINTDLSFDTNFTPEEQIELSHFIMGSTYTNPNFIITDIMTPVEVQDMAQTLYNQSLLILDKVSQPRYTFDVSGVNFVFLKEFQTFIDQLALGCVVTIELSEGVYTYPALLSIEYNYDDATAFKLVFSNRLRMDDAAFEYGDLFNQTTNAGLTATFNSEIWSNFQNNYQDDVSLFMTSALDASKNKVISATNQEFLIDSNGLRGRKFISTGIYDPNQLWMINNLLVFTDDNWDSAKLALGEITTPTGGTMYGLVADSVFGTLLAGNQLTITNENNTFTLDGAGATLIDASFTLTRSDGNSKILIDPEIGIAISKRDTSGSYVNQFYADDQGNIVFLGELSGASGYFSGKIEATSGKIGAWNIDSYGLYDDQGNYIYGDGRIRLGMLEIDGSEAWFHGNIYADNLQGLVQYNQIGSVNADTIITGVLSAIDIYGCNIYWPGVWMGSNIVGKSTIQADDSISIGVGANYLLITTINSQLVGNDVRIGDISATNRIDLFGTITTMDSNMNYGMGISGTFVL